VLEAQKKRLKTLRSTVTAHKRKPFYFDIRLTTDSYLYTVLQKVRKELGAQEKD